MRRLALVALVALLAVGCAGRAFRAARAADSASAYHRFLRAHPSSRHAEEARQRLELVRIRSKPTAEAYREFERRWPSSPLLRELRSVVEQAVFEQARARGTVGAYDEFLEEFADSSYAARARGNRAYVEAAGFDGDPQRLAAFAQEHPKSDFAAEAARSASAPGGRSSTGFRRVGLLIEFSPGVPGAERLARVFSERAQESFAKVGVQLVGLTGPDDPRAASLPVRLRIHHEESEVRSRFEAGEVSSAGVAASTRVTLSRVGQEEPIWSRTTRFQTGGPPGGKDTSILFEAATQRYWDSFFVPIASWNTRAAVRRPLSLDAPVVALDAAHGRGVALFANGSFQLFDLADPENPWPLARYQRPRDLASFEGVRLFGDRAIVFGEDGLEVVSLSGGAPKRIRSLHRGAIGSIVEVEALGGDLITAGKRGLLLVPEDGPPRVLLPRAISGLGRLGANLVFSDGSKLYVSSPALLEQGRVLADMEFGPGASPGRIRVQGHLAVVLTTRGAVGLDLRNPAAPTPVSRIDLAETGALADAMWVRGRLFVLGERGLQLLDGRPTRVVGSADVAARARIDAMGRHLVMTGESWLQVVDTTPFLAASPAAPAPAGPE